MLCCIRQPMTTIRCERFQNNNNNTTTYPGTHVTSYGLSCVMPLPVLTDQVRTYWVLTQPNRLLLLGFLHYSSVRIRFYSNISIIFWRTNAEIWFRKYVRTEELALASRKPKTMFGALCFGVAVGWHHATNHHFYNDEPWQHWSIAIIQFTITFG